MLNAGRSEIGADAGGGHGGIGEGLRRVLLRPEAAAAGGTLAIFIGFSLASDLFLTHLTFVSITNVVAELGIVSIGITLLMIGGQFDLSIGSVIGLSSYAAVHLANQWGFPPVAAFVGAVLFATLLGTINGLIVVTTRLHSFIVTLGTMMIYRGLLTAWTSGFPESVEIPEPMQSILSGPILAGFRMSLLWFLLAVAAGTWLLLRTRMGNWIFAIGQSRDAARNLGIPVDRLTIKLFALTSMMGGLAGVVQVARYQSVDAMRGEGVELNAIAVTVIGGTLLTGGYGSVIGTMFGALIYGMVQQGLVLIGAPGFYFKTLVGVMLVAAVLVNTMVIRHLTRQKPRKWRKAPNAVGIDGEAPP